MKSLLIIRLGNGGVTGNDRLHRRVRERVRETKTASREAFNTFMKERAWVKLYDTFGSVYAWRSTETGKIVQHWSAFTYFMMSGKTPTPLLRTGTGDTE